MPQTSGITSIGCAILCCGNENSDDDCWELVDGTESFNGTSLLFMIFTIDPADFFSPLMKSRLLRVQLLQPLGFRWLLNTAYNEGSQKHNLY